MTAEDTGRAEAVAELDRQLAAVLAGAERAARPDTELEPVRKAAGRRQE